MSIDGRGDETCRVLLRAPNESSSAYSDRIGAVAPDSISRALLSDDGQCANRLAGCIVSMSSPASTLDEVCGGAGSPEAVAQCRAGFESAVRGDELVQPTDAAKRGFIAARIAAPASVYDALRDPGVTDTLY
jgi:hypothetical protein